MIFFRESNGLGFPSEVEIAEKKFLIEVTFSRKRSSSVSIKNDKLVFRMSSYLSKKKALEDFGDLLKKISKKIEKMPATSHDKKVIDIIEDRQFMFSGEEYRIDFTNKGKSVKLVDNTFIIKVGTRAELIEKNMLKLLNQRYYDRLKSYVDALNSSTYNYGIKDFQLKVLESKWGHCTHDNVILLNMKLLNAKPEVLNYVIYHEIAHIKHKNHSKRFWDEVSRFCPNYKLLRKDLKENPPSLFV